MSDTTDGLHYHDNDDINHDHDGGDLGDALYNILGDDDYLLPLDDVHDDQRMIAMMSS